LGLQVIVGLQINLIAAADTLGAICCRQAQSCVDLSQPKKKSNR